MNRKMAIGVCAVLVALVFGSGAIATSAMVTTTTSSPQVPQTASVDIEALNVAREIGAFLSVQPGNFSAAFSFSPGRPVLQINQVLLTLNWNQNSLGHVGDQFSIELNSRSPTLTTMNQFASDVVSLRSQDIRVGVNTINIGVIPINPFATQLTTQYQLYEVRITVEYTILGTA